MSRDTSTGKRWHGFLKVLSYDYNLNHKWISYIMLLVEDSSRRDVTVQVGLVCVEGCGVDSIYIVSTYSVCCCV